MIVEYDGSNYHGFQSQKNAHTIQDTIENALYKLTGHKIPIISAGRTDRGVHALGQVIAFETEAKIPSDKFYLALNSVLPEDIRILNSKEVETDFHPRFQAIKKQYSYYIYTKDSGKTFLRKFAWCNSEPLNIDDMIKACKQFEGRHNFLSFCSSGSSVKTFERTIEVCQLQQKNAYLKFDIKANGFLYNMARIIVGTVVDVGRGKIKVNDINDIIKARDRNAAGSTAPPQGLYLMYVEY